MVTDRTAGKRTRSRNDEPLNEHASIHMSTCLSDTRDYLLTLSHLRTGDQGGQQEQGRRGGERRGGRGGGGGGGGGRR